MGKGWKMKAIGSRAMTKEGRKQQFIKLGNLRIRNGEFEFKRKYDKATPTPYADTFTGEMVLQPTLKVADDEKTLNGAFPVKPETKREAIEFMESNLEFIVHHPAQLKEAKKLLRKSIIEKDGKFIIKNKEKLQEYYDLQSKHVATHEARHLKEAVERGISFSSIKRNMREEIVAEYDAMLQHDGISNRALPRKQLEGIMDVEHQIYLEMIAENKREYVTGNQIERFALEHLTFKGKSFEKEMNKAFDRSMRFTWGGKKLAREAKKVLRDYARRVDSGEGHELKFEEHMAIEDLFNKTNQKAMDKVMKKTAYGEVVAEVRQNLNTLEMMHNNGASFEDIRMKMLRIKQKKEPQKRRAFRTPQPTTA